MATIMIYEPNEIIAQKLCDSLKRRNITQSAATRT